MLCGESEGRRVMTVLATVLAVGLLLCFSLCLCLWREQLELREALRRAEKNEDEGKEKRETWQETT